MNCDKKFQIKHVNKVTAGEPPLINIEIMHIFLFFPFLSSSSFSFFSCFLCTYLWINFQSLLILKNITASSPKCVLLIFLIFTSLHKTSYQKKIHHHRLRKYLITLLKTNKSRVNNNWQVNKWKNYLFNFYNDLSWSRSSCFVGYTTKIRVTTLLKLHNLMYF